MKLSEIRTHRSALVKELRQNPFRPIHTRELLLLDHEREYEKPVSLRIAPEAYRMLYEHTFMFAQNEQDLFCILTEVAFRLHKDGSIALTRNFRSYEQFMKKILEMDVADIITEYCSRYIVRDPFRSYWEFGSKLVEFLKSLRAKHDPRTKRIERQLKPEEIKRIEDELHYFMPRKGFAANFTGRTDKKGDWHTHVITNTYVRATNEFADFHFPTSPHDGDSPILWAIVNTSFIRRILRNTLLAPEEKIRRIMEYHVAGIKQAVCIGMLETDSLGPNTKLTPFIRAAH